MKTIQDTKLRFTNMILKSERRINDRAKKI